MLWAIERHLDGRVLHAIVLGTLVCLMRPELFPFLGLYGLWAWRAEPRLRPLLAGAFVLLPLAWIVPDWIGSGLLLDGGTQARTGRARFRRTLARVGSFRVYRRDKISFPIVEREWKLVNEPVYRVFAGTSHSGEKQQDPGT
jgi:hypothetical protein